MLRPLLIASCLLPASLIDAGEVVIERKPFAVDSSFEARVMPDAQAVTLLQLDALLWRDFKIERVAPHGSSVRKGEVVIAFETRAIDERIEDLKREHAACALALAEAKQALALQEATAAKTLEAATRSAERSAEELAHFTRTDRKSQEEKTAQELRMRGYILDNEKEELRQLQAMYKADDLTEDTEEIVLTRQKHSVAEAEFWLRMEQLDHDRVLQVLLPRRAVDLAETDRLAALALKQAQADVPREIEKRRLALAALETRHQREQRMLAELAKDRSLFEIKAPADALVYYGVLGNGRWQTSELAKNPLEPGNPVQTQQVFASLVARSAALELAAFTDSATARQLSVGAKGIALLGGREDLEIAVAVKACSQVPEPEGRHRVVLSAQWPKELLPSAGSPASVRVMAHHNAQAITLPAAALRYGAEGWVVELKLTDGKTESRRVKRGREAGGRVEILEGLEVGQVVLTP
jgi:HlyD family secretion protein